MTSSSGEMGAGALEVQLEPPSSEEPVPLPPHEQLPPLDTHMPLHLICERLRTHLNIDGSVPTVVDEACRQLGIEAVGSLLTRANACYQTVFGDAASGEPRAPSTPGFDASVVPGRPLDSAVPVAVGVRVALHTVATPARVTPPAEELVDEGDTPRVRATSPTTGGGSHHYDQRIRCEARGGSYESFRGDWELSVETPLYNARPHYTHTLSGMTTVAHLFHCIDPHHGVPRWVIGPSPGDNNGWGFCESAAMLPTDELPNWILWDGDRWHSECDIHFVVPHTHRARARSTTHAAKATVSTFCIIS